jgi:hypothetical protein
MAPALKTPRTPPELQVAAFEMGKVAVTGTGFRVHVIVQGAATPPPLCPHVPPETPGSESTRTLLGVTLSTFRTKFEIAAPVPLLGANSNSTRLELWTDGGAKVLFVNPSPCVPHVWR